MAYASVAVGGLSLLGGLSSSRSSKKAQKEANAIARETLAFNKQRYTDYKTMYGGLEQQLVDDANKGVVADLGGVTSRAVGDIATQYTNAEGAQARANQRMGINPNSGRAESNFRQTALSKAIATAGNVTTNREAEQRNAATQTWDRRAYVNNLGINQMNMSANNVNSANSQLAQSYQNSANQQAAQAGQFFGVTGALAGNYLGGLTKPTTPTPTGLSPSNIPMQNAMPYVMPTPKSVSLINQMGY